MGPPLRGRPRRGFTLIEVLVALATLAVLAGLAWRGVDGMLRARDSTRQQLERTTRLHTVLTQLRQDLEALAPGAADPLLPATLAYDGRTLRLVRNDDDALRVVVWARHDGVWQRWASPAVRRVGELQEQWLRSLQLQGSEPEQVRLLEGVETLDVYCRGADGTRFNCQSTGDLVTAPAPSASQPQRPPQLQVPRVIELHLTIGGQKLQRSLATAVQG